MESKFFYGWRAIVLVCLFLNFSLVSASSQDFENDLFEDDFIEENHSVADPLEPLNRVFFHFNDKLYFWVLKPVAKTYGSVLPEDIRMCIGNAFHNLLAPIRIVNNLLQGKIHNSGIETARFLINTIAGSAGLGDPAKDVFGLSVKEEDLGQTLGTYGVGEGIYICWPILGPSNLRDTVGFIGDSFLNPLHYLAMSDEKGSYLAHSIQRVNKTSLTIDDYDQFIESTFDPYTAMRDFYSQSRRSKIADQDRDNETKKNLKESSASNKTKSLAIVDSENTILPYNISGSSSSLSDLNNIEKIMGVTSSAADNESNYIYYSTNLTVEKNDYGNL